MNRGYRPLIFALALWVSAAAIGFAVEAGALRGFDVAVLLGLAVPARAAGWPVPVLLLATVLGSAAVRLPVAAAVTAALAWRRDGRGAAMLAVTTIGILFGNAGLKLIVGRARPDMLNHLAVETSLSFPSGHSSNAAAVFLALGWVLVRQGGRPGVVWPMVIALVLAVGVSRVVLGVHWPSDVIAGWCVGAGWMLVCTVLFADRAPAPRVRVL
ncbi:phosphatase PAP2 family protein [Sphingomonas montana]|uniref:phosphatase PAP2 family protein n=1 Tax=Sphingomonas montana TaxID=1843236 RepID=UPI0013E9D3E2|nr:phosphatase PAP2 family protein [Sphingomonas montana]